jgi:hypothetical protein
MIVLDNSTGTGISQIVWFEVYQDHLYAGSAMVDFPEEGINWMSYYVLECLLGKRIHRERHQPVFNPACIRPSD